MNFQVGWHCSSLMSMRKLYHAEQGFDIISPESTTVVYAKCLNSLFNGRPLRVL